MLESIIIFISQFLTIYLLGFQSLMVRDHNYLGAFLGSFLIGICQFEIYNIIPDTEKYSLHWMVFLIAGPFAIVSAMKTHCYAAKYLHKLKQGGDYVWSKIRPRKTTN